MAKPINRFSRSSQGSILGQLVDGAIARSNDPRATRSNALDFIQSKNGGLGMNLYPVQRVIVKAIFGIPMDYCEGEVPVWDMHKENLLHTFTDTSYLKYAFDEGRCNVEDWRDISVKGFGNAVLYVGRRGGKSQIVSGIGCTMLRDLLTIDDPQNYYQIRGGSGIDFTLIGTDDESSNRLYAKMRADVNDCKFFDTFLKYSGTDAMTFVSTADRERRNIESSIKVAAFPCTTRAARGPSSFLVAFDEFQFFRSSKDANSDDLYKSATPSTAQFAPPDDPEWPDSKILVISSPGTRSGKMFELHKTALENGVDSNIFTLRCSTAEMNPRIPKAKLAQEYTDNKDTFKAEWGGEFLDGSGSYVPPVLVDFAIDKGRANKTRFDADTIGRKYFWGLDLGMKVDGTGLAIGHLEMVEGQGVTLVYDYIDRMIVGEQFEGPGVEEVSELQKYVQYSELQIEDIIKWLYHMNQVLPCYKGATDQGGGAMLKQLLYINGITTIDLVHLTPQLNSQMYFSLKGFLDNGACRIPDVEKFTREFKKLEAEFVNKYLLRVQAPNEKGEHDDMADAVALVAWMAEKWLDEEGRLDLDPSGKSLQVDRALLNPEPILDPNGVTLSALRVVGRLNQMRKNAFVPTGHDVITNPFSRRRGRR